MRRERSSERERGSLGTIGAQVAREHAGWQAALERTPDAAALIELLCDCSRFGNPEWDAGDADHHQWRCTAGMFEYWCARNPAAVSEWLAALTRQPPDLTW